MKTETKQEFTVKWSIENKSKGLLNFELRHKNSSHIRSFIGNWKQSINEIVLDLNSSLNIYGNASAALDSHYDEYDEREIGNLVGHWALGTAR